MSIIKRHFDLLASKYDFYKKKNSFYYDNLKKLLKSLIPSGRKILEIGCGTGDLLFCLKPKFGQGMDISPNMIKIAKQKHPKFSFLTKILFDNDWDYIYMCDVIEHLKNPKKTFKEITKIMSPKTVFVCTMANPIWEPVLILAEKLKLKMPEGVHYRHTSKEALKLFESAGLKVVKHDFQLLFPKYIPLLTRFINTYLEPIFKRYAFIEYFILTKT